MAGETALAQTASTQASTASATGPEGLQWRDGEAPVRIAADLTLTGVLQPLHGARVTLTGVQDGAREVLMYDVTGSGLLTGKPAKQEAGRLDLLLFNRGSAQVYEKALRSLRYINRAAQPTPGVRYLTIDITDATSFSEPVYSVKINLPEAPESQASQFDFLSPDLLKSTAQALNFDTFSFDIDRSRVADDVAAGAAAWITSTFPAPDSTRQDTSLNLMGGTGFAIFRQPSRPAAGLPEQAAAFADSDYLVFAPAVVAGRPEQHPDTEETGLLADRPYRLFRERQAGAPRFNAAETLVTDPESGDLSGSVYGAPVLETTSDSAPIIALSDSVARRRQRDAAQLQDAA